LLKSFIRIIKRIKNTNLEDMTFVEKQLLSIAQEIRKPASAMAPFIKVLEENWIDSEEAFMALDEAT
jgi:hypothetical protein